MEHAEKKLDTKLSYTPKKDRPAPHPVDYFVPNFGLDQDIKNVHSSLANTEKKMGAWNPVQDDNGVWMVPSADNSMYGKGTGRDGVYVGKAGV